MSLSHGEYQTPEGYKEYPPLTPIEKEAVVNDSDTQDKGSIDRDLIYYAKSAEIALENQARLRQRQEIIAVGNTIAQARQNELESRLNAPKTSVVKRVFKMLTTGQFDASVLRIVPVDKAQLINDNFRELLNKEGNIGASLLGKPFAVGRQEFFLSDSHPNEWFWHMQSSINPDQSRTIRYAVYQTEGIVKSIDGGQYQYVNGDELNNFVDLTKIYSQRVIGGLYKNHVQSNYDLAA